MANMEMSDMIATMALNGATKEELHRCIEYSAAVIQLEKMRDAKGIDELERKYCGCDVTHSPIEYEPMHYEERVAAMDCFFEKYGDWIDQATDNSLLGMICILNNAWLELENERLQNDNAIGDTLEDIMFVETLLAQMWADENQDIELSCVDPATGEETVVKNEHKCVLAPDGVCPDGCHNGDGYLCEFDDCPYEKKEENENES